jgi:hypothetical protein
LLTAGDTCSANATRSSAEEKLDLNGCGCQELHGGIIRKETWNSKLQPDCDESAADNDQFWGGETDFMSEDDLERNNHGGTEREQEGDEVLPPFEEPELAAEDFAITNADLELLDRGC